MAMRALWVGVALLACGGAWAESPKAKARAEEAKAKAEEAARLKAEEEQKARAKASFQAGVDLYDSGQYEKALGEFQKAHAISHNPALYFNMAACEERAHHYEAAVLLLRQYLLEQPNAEDRAKVEARIKVMQERDDAMKRPEPKPAETAAPAPAAAPPPNRRVVSWAMLGVTGALALGAIGAGAYTATEHGRLQGACGMTAAGCSDDAQSGMKSAALATDVLIGVAAASAVVTVVLFIVEPRLNAKKRERAARMLAPGGVRF
jgi:tetratricopeptide (TPR) repeat protein